MNGPRSQDPFFDAVVVGTGFASSFFLHEYLRRSASPRVLVLEAGPHVAHADQARMRRESGALLTDPSRDLFVNRTPDKPWNFTRAFGGGSNNWFGQTPRMLPEDFRLASTYGVATDWPVSYDDVEEYYCLAEELMEVSGPEGETPYPMSRPYPQPPHRFSDPDRLLKAAFPDQFFEIPTARARVASASGRGACCNAAVCHVCPANAKFTVPHDLRSVYSDPRVTVRLGARVTHLEHESMAVTRVRYVDNDGDQAVRGDLIVLGANAIFNPHILLRSGIEHSQLGVGLGEQVGVGIRINLDGVDNFQGSTITTGLGFMGLRGEHRRKRAGFLLLTDNRPTAIRHERGRWRQVLNVIAVFEDLRREDNRVIVSATNPDLPTTVYSGHSDYAQRGLDALDEDLQRVLGVLPVEDYEIGPLRGTESHIQGTTVMGSDPATSVVDSFGVHHRLRNLVVLGSGTFPTAAAANPSLTISALAMRAGRHLG